jgi:PHP family Zn ribbon phosphoesterase
MKIKFRRMTMKLDSDECQKLLKEYSVNTDMEKLAVKVLTTKDEDVYKIPELENLDTQDEWDELSDVIGKIRKDIGLD